MIKKLKILSVILSLCCVNFSLQADLVDNIKNDLIDPKAKSKDKEKKKRGKDKEDTESNSGKTRVTEDNRYQKDLDSFRYLAFYFSNKAASKTYKKAEGKTQKFLFKAEEKNDKAEETLKWNSSL